MTVYSHRPITLIALPASEGTMLLHPEQTVLKCNMGVDVGALCFLKRSNEKRVRGLGRKVALDSFDQARAKSVHTLVNKILQESAARRLAVATIETRCGVLIKFIDWCDANGHERVMEGIDAGREAFRGFVAHLRHLSDVRGISLRSIETWQTNLVLVLNQHFDISNISLGTNPISPDWHWSSRTEAPTQVRFAKFLSFHEAIFNGICDLILENRPFPHPVEMPKFVGYKDKMWIFPPDSGWTKHPESPLRGKRNLAYDYVDGRIKSGAEVISLYCSKHSAEASIEKTLTHIAKCNDDMRASARIRMASLANLVFTRVFEAITGANRADIGRIEWTGDVAAQIAKPDTERQGFRSLKVRANNREVFYQVGAIYFPLLRKFARLRAWLLNGSSYGNLFFHYSLRDGVASSGPERLKKSHYTALQASLLVVYPKYKQISLSNQKTRAAKQDDAIRNYDPATSAKVMQHGLSTALRHYSNGSVELAQEEMGDFLQKVHMVVIGGRHHTPIQEERATGNCISRNHPKPIIPAPAIQPDCQQSEGCLFCDKYRAHADEKDVRKLLSAKFVVEQTSVLANSAEEYDRVFGATIKRIEQILLEIRTIDVSMTDAIDRICKEVARGEMDNYWSTKMEELVEAGIL